MKQSGKVSVVIPVYNGEAYIAETVNRILRSAYQQIEVILVDDGSTDNSPAVCERLRQKDDRVVLHRKTNGGIVSARNCGAAMASGKYLCFCDQDDIVERNCYARQVERIEADQSDICICSVGQSIEGKMSAFELLEDSCCEGGEILEQLLYPILFNGFDVPVPMGTGRRYPHIWSCMFRMSFWRAHGLRFRAYVNYEDDLLVKVEALAKAERVSTVSAIGYLWRVNYSSESHSHRYIEDIAVKQQQCYEDLHSSVVGKIDDGQILEWLKKVLHCRQYLEAVQNIADARGRRDRGSIRAYYDKNIYSRCFDECISASEYVKKGTVKARVILKILANRQTMLSYRAEKILEHIRMIALHSHVMTKVERLSKGVSARKNRIRGSR